jgi:hypothetical protein
LMLFVLGCLYWPLMWLFPLYLLWLIHETSSRAKPRIPGIAVIPSAWLGC